MTNRPIMAELRARTSELSASCDAVLKGIYNSFGPGENAPVIRARGGIGRREGLRILWSNPCRFDPCRAHQRSTYSDLGDLNGE